MTPATRRACLKAVIADTPPKQRQEKIEMYRGVLRKAMQAIGKVDAEARFLFLNGLFSSWKKEGVR